MNGTRPVSSAEQRPAIPFASAERSFLSQCLTGIASLVNSLANLMWKVPPPVPEVELKKMQATLVKAVKEHGSDELEFSSRLSEEPSSFPLEYFWTAYAKKKKCGQMEDVYFITTTADYILAGVFDGHGDQGRAATYAAHQFNTCFYQDLINQGGSVYKAFQLRVDEIHKYLFSNFEQGGTTAVVCYIDKQINRLYTMTLGDSQAKLLTAEGRQAIPLSRMINWSTRSEALRAAEAYRKAGHAELAQAAKEWPKQASMADELRFPYWHLGSNVSRAMGDPSCHTHNSPNEPQYAISQKISVTVCSIQQGDLIVLGSDGLLWSTSEAMTLTNPFSSLEKKTKEIVLNASEWRLRNTKDDDITAIVITTDQSLEEYF